MALVSTSMSCSLVLLASYTILLSTRNPKDFRTWTGHKSFSNKQEALKTNGDDSVRSDARRFLEGFPGVPRHCVKFLFLHSQAIHPPELIIRYLRGSYKNKVVAARALPHRLFDGAQRGTVGNSVCRWVETMLEYAAGN